ncbi:MAG: GNAT family N-acetyltransferase [Candidatus Roizmanbacteria bacterium]|nr:GNAT family N-acetyltransferase [Candidatus Roizmanbacteria bacterium]
MSNIIFRKYQNKDKEQVKKVVLSAMQDIRPGYSLDSEERNRDLDDIQKQYKDKGIFWVAVDKGTVIGTVGILEDSNNIVWLKRLFLLNTYRNKGIGKTLLYIALEHCSNSQIRKIRAVTSIHAAIAEKMLQKNGFKLYKREKDLLFYEKKLNKFFV